jgi:hypothetical protein
MRPDVSAERPVVNVNIDLIAIAKIAHVGVRRAALFLGLGLNGVNQPGFKDYELHKLPPGENLAVLPPDIIARGAPDHVIERFKTEFSTWVTGCGLREMLEHYGLMLDHIHKYGLLVAQTRHFLDLIGDPEKLQYEFARRLGIPDKHDRLKNRFQIEPEFASHIDALYSARNALTHGLGTVRAEDIGPDGTLVLQWLAFEMHARGEETDNVVPLRELFGKVTTEAMSLYIRAVERKLSYKVGDKIALTAQDLYEILFFMELHMIPKAMAAFAQFLKDQGVEGPMEEGKERAA